MEFHVPQFIEVESKIFGPLTIKQFIYIVGGVGLSVVIWFFVPFRFLSIILIAAVMGFSLALAFFRYNEKPFIEILEAAILYSTNSKLFLWKKQPKQPKPEKKDGEKIERLAPGPPASVPRLSESKLREMTWDLDVNGGVRPDNDTITESEKEPLQT